MTALQELQSAIIQSERDHKRPNAIKIRPDFRAEVLADPDITRYLGITQNKYFFMGVELIEEDIPDKFIMPDITIKLENYAA